MHQFKLILIQIFIYTSLVGWLGSGTWSWVSIRLADKVGASIS